MLPDEHVGRVDAAVDDPSLVEVGEDRGRGGDQTGDLGHRHRPDHVERASAVGEPQLPPIVGARRAQELDDPGMRRELQPIALRLQLRRRDQPGGALDDDSRRRIRDNLDAMDHISTI